VLAASAASYSVRCAGSSSARSGDSPRLHRGGAVYPVRHSCCLSFSSPSAGARHRHPALPGGNCGAERALLGLYAEWSARHESIPKGRGRRLPRRAAYHRIMRLIVLPQALRVIIPPTIGVYVSTIRNRSLASIIGFWSNCLSQGMAIREANALRGSADVLVAVAFGYFVICSSLSQVGRHLERRYRARVCGHRQRRPTGHRPQRSRWSTANQKPKRRRDAAMHGREAFRRVLIAASRRRRGGDGAAGNSETRRKDGR